MGAGASSLAQVVPALLGVGLGVGSGLTAPNPYQPRTPYEGANSPENTLTEARGADEGVYQILSELLGRGVQLPDAVVNTPQGFSGGDLPMPIGLSGSGQMARPPQGLPGLHPPSLFNPGNGAAAPAPAAGGGGGSYGFAGEGDYPLDSNNTGGAGLGAGGHQYQALHPMNKSQSDAPVRNPLTSPSPSLTDGTGVDPSQSLFKSPTDAALHVLMHAAGG